MDVIYNPLETTLLRESRLNGATTINGTSMLINQGIVSFEIFTGETQAMNLLKRHCWSNYQNKKIFSEGFIYCSITLQ